MPKETNIVQSLKIQAAAAGTNLTEVCRDANIPRQTIERWKNGEPKTIKILRAVEAAIEKRKQKQKQKV